MRKTREEKAEEFARMNEERRLERLQNKRARLIDLGLDSDALEHFDLRLEKIKHKQLSGFRDLIRKDKKHEPIKNPQPIR